MSDKIISSLQNPKVKTLLKLRRRGPRDANKLLLIDGIRPLTMALKSGFPVRTIYYVEETADPEVMKLAKSNRVMLQTVTEKVFSKIGYGENPDGHLGLAAQPELNIGNLPRTSDPLYIVVEGLEKPGNLGAVLRSADAAGVTGVIVCNQGTDIFNPNVVWSSRGAIFTVPVALAGSEEAIKWLKERNIQIFAAAPGSGSIYTDVDFTLPAAVAIGSEHSGLSSAWLNNIRITIPMKGRVDSLNAAQTATILMFEAFRQRGCST